MLALSQKSGDVFLPTGCVWHVFLLWVFPARLHAAPTNPGLSLLLRTRRCCCCCFAPRDLPLPLNAPTLRLLQQPSASAGQA